ncbi:hypothetical protein [Enterobacter hormaechei]|uniref:hypothetical protein n=1 Tax=Enterobacter hormaechei TaxID=158836 RepID=UPI0029D4E1CF|nr:hypothetical protein [Enterobacter hormaechei]MDX7122044.1 hypothetical protein [Enterobacter hormaechei]
MASTERFIKLFKVFAERGYDYLTPLQALIYLNMLDEYNYFSQELKKEYHPTVASLAKKSFSEKKAATKAIEYLVEFGLVSYNREPTRGRANAYTVLDWRKHETIMSGSTNAEEREQHYTTAGTASPRNYRLAREAEEATEEVGEVFSSTAQKRAENSDAEIPATDSDA